MYIVSYMLVSFVFISFLYKFFVCCLYFGPRLDWNSPKSWRALVWQFGKKVMKGTFSLRLHRLLLLCFSWVFQFFIVCISLFWCVTVCLCVGVSLSLSLSQTDKKRIFPLSITEQFELSFVICLVSSPSGVTNVLT